MRPAFYERRLRPNLGISAGLLFRIFLIGLVVFAIHKVVETVREGIAWNEATRLAALAKTQLAANQENLARDNLKNALSLSPNHVEAARLAAQLYDRDGDPRAPEYHLVVLESPDASIEDLRLAAHSAMRNGRTRLAMQWADKVAHITGDPSYPHLIKAGLLANTDEVFERERELRKALALRESPETLSALASFFLSEKDQLDLHATEAAALLRRQSEVDHSRGGAEALRLGLTSGILEPAEQPSWIAAYRSHPAATRESQLRADELEIERDPSSMPAVVAALVLRLATAPPRERISAGRWLLQKNEPAALQQLLPLADAMTDPEAFEMWINAANVLGQREAVRAALALPGNPLRPIQTLALRALSAKLEGNGNEAQRLWNEAFANCGDRQMDRVDLLAHLARAGEWGLFRANLPALLNDPDWSLKGVEALAPSIRSQRDSKLMADFFKQTMSARFLAFDPLHKDQAAFTELILDRPVVIEELEARELESPAHPGFRITHSLALLRGGYRVKALLTLEEGDVLARPELLSPCQKGVVAAVYAANGRVQEVRELAETIPLDKLTRQEEAFFKLHMESPPQRD